jgi:hypothetical protein
MAESRLYQPDRGGQHAPCALGLSSICSAEGAQNDGHSAHLQQSMLDRFTGRAAWCRAWKLPADIVLSHIMFFMLIVCCAAVRCVSMVDTDVCCVSMVDT